jgi:hypothetical protein
MPKTTDPDWIERLEKAKKGELDPGEWTEIDGELNDEGEAKLVHHFKAKKVFVRGIKTKFVVPEEEAKQVIEKIKK